MCLPVTQTAAASISTSLHSPRMAANRGKASLLAANAASLIYLHDVGPTTTYLPVSEAAGRTVAEVKSSVATILAGDEQTLVKPSSVLKAAVQNAGDVMTLTKGPRVS